MDTVSAYGNEVGVREGIQRTIDDGIITREDIFVTTKLWPNNYNNAGIDRTHGKSSAQIILRWHLQAGHIAIPGSNNPDHIQEDFEIFDFELTDAEMARIAALDTKVPYFGEMGDSRAIDDAADRWGLDVD